MTKEKIDQNITAERAVLGAILRDNTASSFWAVSDRLEANHFGVPLHREVYSVVRDICTSGKRFTIAAAAAKFEGMEYENEIDVSAYLNTLAFNGQEESALDFVDDIIELAQKRSTKALLEKALKELTEGKKSVDDIAGDVDGGLASIVQTAGSSAPKFIHDLADEVLDLANKAYQSGTASGFTTGLTGLDEIIGTIMPGDLGGILAAQKEGKSALAAQIGMHIAKTAPALMIQMEMTAHQVAGRELTALTGISNEALMRGEFNFDEFERTRDARKNLQSHNFSVWQDGRNANGRLTVRQISRIAKAHKHKHGLSCLIIDQLDKIIGEGKHNNPFERVAAITADLKHLANEMDVAIILLDQRTREAKKRDNPVPRATDSRFPSLEHDCDWLVGLWRLESWLEENKPVSRGYSQEKDDQELQVWRKKLDDAKDRADAICLLHRRRRAKGTRAFTWNGERTRFLDGAPTKNGGYHDQPVF